MSTPLFFILSRNFSWAVKFFFLRYTYPEMIFFQVGPTSISKLPLTIEGNVVFVNVSAFQSGLTFNFTKKIFKSQGTKILVDFPSLQNLNEISMCRRKTSDLLLFVFHKWRKLILGNTIFWACTFYNSTFDPYWHFICRQW